MIVGFLRVRAVQAVAALLGILVLVISVVTNVLSARERQIAAQDSKLQVALGRQVDAQESYFEQARMINLLLAQNRAFTDFYEAPGTVRQKIDAGGPLMDRVNDALFSFQTLFPDRIGEVCFLDRTGQEIARVMDGIITAPERLDSDDAESAFFAPTLELGPGQVYQAREYESPDTRNRVISNSTMVTTAGQSGIVHFEIALDSFRMPETGTGIAASIVDADDAKVLVDSRSVLVGATVDQSMSPIAAREQDSGVATLGARRVAFRRVAATENNANNWYVAVSAPAAAAGWTHGLSVGSLALVLLALLAILASAAGGWKQLREARHAATHDPLTGLPNRALLGDRLRALLLQDRPAAVLVADLERFKEVNEQLGHHHGELLLRQVAGRLAAVAPGDATVARLGGDDFAVLLPDAGQEAAEALAPEVLAALHQTFDVDGAGLDIEARVGVACAPAHGDDPDLLLRHADGAMQLAKEHHDGARTYVPAGEGSSPSRLALLGDLRRALDADDQITVHYQPKVRLLDGKPSGAEALVRWNHPRLGRVTPDQFIPLAETTTLIHALTDRVLEIAVRQAKRWLDEGLRLPVAVNLSTRCLHDPDLPRRVFDLLDRVGLPAALLDLEITESMVMIDPERALQVLNALHEGGIRLSVDDFGTGHSSMAYLQRLPVDELKIDRSFVQQMSAGPAGAVLARTAIALGHNLGLSVVAEGIEDAATVDALRELGCDVGQGYHLGKPMPAEELRGWLRDRAADRAVSPAGRG
jgi:diguanylate cyclase (GGDEF)-like protein